MIIAISGTPGSGKSTVAMLIAKAVGFRHRSSGDFVRQMAAERGVSLLDLMKQAESDISIDKEIDERTEKIGQEEDDFVIDSRLAFHFIPDSIKIFLKVDPKEAAKRIFSDVKDEKRKTETKYPSQEAAFEATRERFESEIKRYNEYYNIDYIAEANYDLVIDTTNLDIESVINKVLEFLKQKGLKTE